MFFIAYAFKGHVHAFAGRVIVVSHSSCRTSAMFKYFCPLYPAPPNGLLQGSICQENWEPQHDRVISKSVLK